MAGLSTDTAALSAHDACHGEGFLVIRNDQCILCKNALLTIEQRDALLGLGVAYPNAAL